MRFFYQLLLLCFSFSFLNAQAPHQPTSAELFQKLKKLQVLGSVLYIAAHPDDENTRLISYLANELNVEVTYLSLTRGDGGQNLIGPEIAELLGVIRTQELLAARRLDGGQQMFSRANDFGFSKHPDETLKIWNKEEVLGDAVWAIRQLQPDVVINRFDHNSAGKTHGHHTASAMISMEAFDLAGKRSAYPDQLKLTQPWKPSRLFFNTTWWFYGSREAFDKADKSKMAVVDVGVFYPLLGKSNTEIAAESRSQHRCQGMGNLGTRGTQLEYLDLLKGDLPKNKDDIFDGINTTWDRLPEGWRGKRALMTAEKDFDFAKPWKCVPALMEAYRLLRSMPESHWTTVKKKEMEKLIQGCLGLFAEAVASDYSATPGEDVKLNLEIIQRGSANTKLHSIEFLPMAMDTTFDLVLQTNSGISFSKNLTLPADLAFTNAYWLNENWELGMYTVADQRLRGLPETPHQLKVRWNLVIENEPLTLETDVAFKKDDPVKGEVYRPFEVTPPVFANLQEKVYVFTSNVEQAVKVTVKAGKANLLGELGLEVPKNWRAEPASIPFEMTLKGEEKTFEFKLFPPAGESEGIVVPLVRTGDQVYRKSLTLIEYDHIPTQTVLLNSEAKAVKIDLRRAGTEIAYIKGAGDEIPASLIQMGYNVTMLDDHQISAGGLQKYDAVVLGIRAYNTVERLKFAQPELMEYVKNGGTLVVQYNTNFDLVTNQLGPYPFKISRDRVTVEEAEVRFLKPEHAVLNTPNKITAKDFEGWVQERGLYFPSEWDSNYEAILSCNDPGESPKDGGLLVAKYGDGYYIYTGYSWFRELPAGVPGAYRLFANLLSIGKSDKP